MPKPKPIRIFLPQIGPYTQLINETSLIKMWNTIIGAEELTYIISSYQTLQEEYLEKLLLAQSC